MNPKIQAVAFDMDGLMFDTEVVYHKTGTELMRRRGCDYSPELCQAVMGTPPQASFETMIRWHSLNETWQELQEESNAIFLELLKDGFDAMPGLFKLLAELERRKIPKCICTSSTWPLVAPVLAAYDMAGRFNFILTAEDITRGKPNPEIYLKAAARFGVEPSSMLVLEDSVFGTQAARAAGAFAVTVLAAHNRTQDFSHASMIVDRLDAPGVFACLDSGRPFTK
ncbi:MAG: HAD family phosphatase [Planctomycetaceae bacterium]|nr:HAD family phosphatase [Planctomycetaceae bacterium]